MFKLHAKFYTDRLKMLPDDESRHRGCLMPLRHWMKVKSHQTGINQFCMPQNGTIPTLKRDQFCSVPTQASVRILWHGCKSKSYELWKKKSRKQEGVVIITVTVMEEYGYNVCGSCPMQTCLQSKTDRTSSRHSAGRSEQQTSDHGPMAWCASRESKSK